MAIRGGAGVRAGYGPQEPAPERTLDDAAALLPVLAAAAAWATLDALRKRLASRIAAVPLTWLLSVGALPVFGAWAAVTGGGWPAGGYWLPAALTFVGSVAATVLMLRALAIADLSVAIPMLSLTPVFSALVGWALLDERPGPSAGLGILLVVAGAFVLQRPPPGAPRRIDVGALMMAGVALLWSGTAVLDKVAIQHAPVPVHAALQVAASALALGGFLAVRGRLREVVPPAGQRVAAVAAVLVFGVALGSQLVAVSGAPVSLVETVKRAVGLASAVVVGRLVFDEPLTAWRVVGVLMMGAGAVVVVQAG